MPPARSLILETSQRVGRVALAAADCIVAERVLDEARRHARDLVPCVRELFVEQGWKPRDLEAVIVSRGPGSYTGLRVGLMSAKTLAYATGCALLAVDTFAALAEQASGRVVDVIADAQQDKIYTQRFTRDADAAPWQPLTPLAVLPFADWAAQVPEGSCVLGPGLERFAAPGQVVTAPRDAWFPSPSSMLRMALRRWQAGERDDAFQVEPLYLRVSSAEEKWSQFGR